LALVLTLVSRALLLGLSAGLFCAGFCLPVIGPALLAGEPRGFRDSARSLGLFLVGRLVGYLLFGFLFGLLGGRLTLVGQARAFLLPAAYLLLGLLLVLFGLVRTLPHLGPCRLIRPRLESRWCLFAVGCLTGVNFCPPFLLAVSAAVDAASPWKGLVFFAVFFVATSVYLAPLLAAGAVARSESLRFAGRVASVLAGVWFACLGVVALARRL